MGICLCESIGVHFPLIREAQRNLPKCGNNTYLSDASEFRRNRERIDWKIEINPRQILQLKD